MLSVASGISLSTCGNISRQSAAWHRSSDDAGRPDKNQTVWLFHYRHGSEMLQIYASPHHGKPLFGYQSRQAASVFGVMQIILDILRHIAASLCMTCM